MISERTQAGGPARTSWEVRHPPASVGSRTADSSAQTGPPEADPLQPSRLSNELLMFLMPVRYAAVGGPNHVVSASVNPA
jgi:hypothetical protein